MNENSDDQFIDQNKIKPLKNKMELLGVQMECVSSLIKNVCVELNELDNSQPTMPPPDHRQKPYQESDNPHSKTVLEKIGDGG